MYASRFLLELDKADLAKSSAHFPDNQQVISYTDFMSVVNKLLHEITRLESQVVQLQAELDACTSESNSSDEYIRSIQARVQSLQSKIATLADLTSTNLYSTELVDQIKDIYA